MQFKKQHLTDLFKCYAVGLIEMSGRKKILIASEGEDACYLYDAEDFTRSTVWEKPGGTMSFVAIPEHDGEFLTTQKFYGQFQSVPTELVWAKPGTDGWDIRKILELPYLHRFDIIKKKDVRFFIGATLCTSKKFREDWSDPGKVYVGILPDDLNEKMILQPVMTGLTKNHGYCKGIWKGEETVFVTADEGVFVITPPDTAGAAWKTECILQRPVSDIALCDIDGDGEMEFATIEPFHGNSFLINKWIGSEWKVVYSCENELEFAHAIWGGSLRGKPTFIGGCRKAGEELFYIQYNGDKFITTIIESGIGPSNVAVINGKDHDLVISANRTKGEAAVYTVSDD